MTKGMWLGLLLFFGVIVSCADTHDQATQDEAHYQDMVCNGYWPDYENVQPDCTGYPQ